MEDVLKSWGARAPELTVLVAVVWMFLRFMGAARSEFTQAMREINALHIEARHITHKIIERNTEALIANSKALTILETSFLGWREERKLV